MSGLGKSLTGDLTTTPEPERATHTIVPTGRRSGATLPGSHLRMGMWVVWHGPNGESVPGDDEKRVGIVVALDRVTGETAVDQVDVHGCTLLARIPVHASGLEQARDVDIPRSRRAEAGPAALRKKGDI